MDTGLHEKRTITSVGVPTRDRPSSLDACLRSYLENCARHGRSPEFLVADDSSEHSANHTTAILQTLGREFNARIRYAGREDKERFVDILAREAGVSNEVVHFGLLGDDAAGRSTGANRNSLLLDSAGSLLLTVDDDTVCRTATPSDVQTELASFSEYDPTEFWFFPNRQSVLQSTRFLDLDICGCHEIFLGRAVDRTKVDEGGGRVTMTLNGLACDSGMASPRYYLGLTGASRDRLVASADVYHSALTTREIVRSVRQPTIVSGPFCMTTFVGFDNRFVLPPFFPVQRNSDGIFGHLLHKCVARSRSVFLPSILVHAPEPPRSFAPGDLWNAASSLRLSDIVISAVLGKQTADVESTEARLIELGRHLEWLGSLSLEDFEEYIRTAQQFRNFGFITALHGQLQKYESSPEYWANDVRRMIELMSQASSREDYVLPVDLRDGRAPDATRRLSQSLVRKFGALLQAWPAMFHAAVRLRANGTRISRAI